MKNYIYYIYWLLRTKPMRWHFPKYKILSFEQTVSEIIMHKKSISRFGDGEFRLFIEQRKTYFQELNEKIVERIHEVLIQICPIISSYSVKFHIRGEKMKTIVL